jgi:hypothetical protein
MSDYIQRTPALEDLEGVGLLPEAREALATEERPIPTIYDELKWLDNLSSEHAGRSDQSKSFRNDFSDSFHKLKELKARHYVKNLSFLQRFPNNKNVENAFLYGLRQNRHIPLLATLPRSETQREGGFRYYPINPELRAESDGLEQVPFYLDNFPTQLSKTKKGGYNFKNEAVTPSNTKFFPNSQEVAKALTPFYQIFRDPYKKSMKELIEDWNDGVESEEDKIDPSMAYGVSSFGEEAREYFQLARVVRDPEEAAFTPKNSEVFLRPTQEGEKEDKNRFSLELSYRNLFAEAPDFIDSVGADGSEEAFEQERDKYWAEKGFGTPTYSSVKRKLVSHLAQRNWGNLPDEDKKLMKEYLGAMAQFYPDIPVDGDGLGSFRHPDGWDGHLSHKTFSNISAFQRAQLELFNEPVNWNTDQDKDFNGKVSGQDYFQYNLDKQVNSINRYMQRMVKGWGRKAPYPEGEGLDISNEEALADARRELDTAFHSEAIIEEMGMEGASPEEVDDLVKMISQYLELANLAAIHGEEFRSFRNRSHSHYIKNGIKRLYDFRRRKGATEHSNDYYKENISNDVDPVYELVTEFLKDAENYVVMAGRNGKKIIPLVEWLGLSTSDEGSLLLPSRVMSIKLSGTDVSKNRELQELNKWTIFGKKPLDTWWVEDKLSGETEEIDLGDAAKVLKKDTNP